MIKLTKKAKSVVERRDTAQSPEAFVAALIRSKNPTDNEALDVLQRLSAMRSGAAYVDVSWGLAKSLREGFPRLALSSSSRDYLVTPVDGNSEGEQYAKSVYEILRVGGSTDLK